MNIKKYQEEHTELYLTKKEYLIVLKKVRAKIAKMEKSGEKAWGYDDTTIGQKNTECNVGLCHDDPEIFTKEMNLWPEQYPERVAPKYLQDKHYCPLSKVHHSDGCFYKCRFFKDKLEDLGAILALYDQRIAELKRGEDER